MKGDNDLNFLFVKTNYIASDNNNNTTIFEKNAIILFNYFAIELILVAKWLKKMNVFSKLSFLSFDHEFGKLELRC